MESISHMFPYMCTGMIAFVLDVIFCFTSLGSIKKVSFKTSAKTGVAPHCQIAKPGIATVKAGIITSSPAPTPNASRAI